MLKKLPQISLIVFGFLSIVISILFFVGLGKTTFTSPNTYEELRNSTYTDPFLYGAYILLAIACCLTLVFVIIQLVKGLMYNTRRTVIVLIALVALGAVFTISWYCGSPDEIKIVGYDGGQNSGWWAQFSDMWLYSSYTLFLGTLIALAGSIIYSKVK